MKLEYLSDIHLEFKKKFPKLENDDYQFTTLVLLGDIGYPGTRLYNDFISHCSRNFKNVLVLFGNHEFYNTKRRKRTMDEIIKCTESFPENVHFLNNTVVYIHRESNELSMSYDTENSSDYIKIIGSTLWSVIEYGVSTYINDYNKITITKDKLLSPLDTHLFFEKSKQFILQEMEISPENMDCVLCTHHGTHSLCNGEKYINSPLVSAFVTDIPELKKYSNLAACINGHTHFNINLVVPGTSIKLLSNCVGYNSENTGYHLNKFIEFL
jgi:predicted phosphodiesterase